MNRASWVNGFVIDVFSVRHVAGALALLGTGCADAPEEVASTSVASGCSRGGIIAQVEQLRVPAGALSPRTGHALASLGGGLFVARGVVDDFETQTNTFPLDLLRVFPHAERVRELPQRGDDEPGGLSYSCMAGSVLPSPSLYLFGGAHYVFELRPDFFGSLVVSDTLWRYDLRARRWSSLSPVGDRPAARTGCVAESFGGFFYMFAGIDRYFNVNNELWRFDPRENQWTELAPNGPVPPPRYKPAVALDQKEGKVYFYGGLAVGAAGFERVDDFWVYDIAENSFRELPNGIAPNRDQGAMGVLGGPMGRRYLVHVGGDLPTDVDCVGFPQRAKATGEVWAFDIAAESWTQLETRGPVPRLEYHAGATVGNAFYFLGGWAEEPDEERTCRQVWSDAIYELRLR